MEVDLTIRSKVNLDGHWYKVQYEGFHIICASCGCYGHVTRNVSKADETKTMTAEATRNQNTNQEKGEPSTTMHKGAGPMAAAARAGTQEFLGFD